MNTSTIIRIAISVTLLLGCAVWLDRQMRIDACLDAGGQWRDDENACRH